MRTRGGTVPRQIETEGIGAGGPEKQQEGDVVLFLRGFPRRCQNCGGGSVLILCPLLSVSWSQIEDELAARESLHQVCGASVPDIRSPFRVSFHLLGRAVPSSKSLRAQPTADPPSWLALCYSAALKWRYPHLVVERGASKKKNDSQRGPPWLIGVGQRG